MKNIFNILMTMTISLLLLPMLALAGESGWENADTTAGSIDSLQLIKDSSFSDSEEIPASVNIAEPADSAVENGSSGEGMYKSALSAMRRDALSTGKPDTMAARSKKNAEPKFMTPKITPSPQPEHKDSFLEIPARQTSHGHKTGITKKGVIITVGVCALIGGGIAAYFLTKSSTSAVNINNRIPNPPDPPASHFSEP
jgi:hypothetical protein